MHEEDTCESFQTEKAEDPLGKVQRAEQEQLSAEAVKMISKPCPKCTANLDKYTGCDHVTCKFPTSSPPSLSMLR